MMRNICFEMTIVDKSWLSLLKVREIMKDAKLEGYSKEDKEKIKKSGYIRIVADCCGDELIITDKYFPKRSKRCKCKSSWLIKINILNKNNLGK